MALRTDPPHTSEDLNVEPLGESTICGMPLLRRNILNLIVVAVSCVACGINDGATTSEHLTQTSLSNAPKETRPDGVYGGTYDSLFGPPGGAQLAVIGTAHDSTADLRETPDTAAAVIARLPADANGILATGHNRAAGSATWYRVDYAGTTGWINARDAGQLGGVDDATSEVVTKMGSNPVAATIEDLGGVVAQQFASTEPHPRIEQTRPSRLGDLHEVTFDVIGLGDDATLGYRLHVFGASEENGQVALKSVERTVICARAVTDDGLCV